jgi:hypothetical protein
MFEGSTCSYFRPTWKLASHAMVAKVLWTASWVHVCSLPWAQCKRWIPIRLMGCVHTHQRIFTIGGWGIPSCIWNTTKKIEKASQSQKKIGLIVSQALALGPKYDKIQAQWASDILLKSMLEKIRWCKHFEMEFWSWIICCPMNCSNERRHVWVGGGRKSQVALKCCWRGKVLLSIHVKASRRKGH